ncbi:hypothetical protein CLU79DRAFT_890043 [Phycomyces nitens]|nr:hypothetical protein CLU79DRAFT_890043 [Phycomyces nitens]
MLASELPFEILSNIALRLSLVEKKICTTVCRAWKEPFQRYLWDTMEVNQVRYLDPSNMSKITLDNYKTNGHRVRKLKAQGQHFLTPVEAYYLKSYFENTESFTFKLTSTCSILQMNMLNLNTWTSLQSLEIDWGLCYRFKSKYMLDNLASIPRLKSLIIFGQLKLDELISSEDELDLIHTLFPRLEYLKVGISLIKDQSSWPKRTKPIVPATSLTEARFKSGMISMDYLYYLSQKYPCIHTLEINILQKVSKELNTWHESAKIVLSLPGLFPRLKKLYLNETLQVNVPHISFCELLKIYGVEPSFLNYKFATNDGISKTNPINAVNLICFNLPSVKTLTIDLSLDKSNAYTIVTGLVAYRNLVFLNLLIPFTSIALDVILDSCWSLKTIKLSSQTLFVRPGFIENLLIHGLTRLELESSIVDILVFGHISARCPNLKELVANKIKIQGPTSEPGTACIDMSYSKLESLKLEDVQFYNSTDYNCNPDTRINLFVLEHSQKLSQIQADQFLSLYDINPIDIWVHQYGKGGRHRSPFLYRESPTRELLCPEVKYAQNFFQNFYQNADKYFKRADTTRHMDGLMAKRFWKSDLNKVNGKVDHYILLFSMLHGFQG